MQHRLLDGSWVKEPNQSGLRSIWPARCSTCGAALPGDFDSERIHHEWHAKLDQAKQTTERKPE